METIKQSLSDCHGQPCGWNSQRQCVECQLCHELCTTHEGLYNYELKGEVT